MNRRLPIRPARKCRRSSVRIFHHQCGDHRRRIGRRHSVGIGDIMHRLNRNRVGPCAELARHVRAHKLLPRHLLPRRKRVRRQHLRPVDPCRNRILPGRIKRARRTASQASPSAGKRCAARLAFSAARNFASGLVIQAAGAWRTASFFSRFVANPLRPPSVPCHQARLPPADFALCIRPSHRIPHLHPPESARRRRDCRPIVAQRSKTRLNLSARYPRRPPCLYAAILHAKPPALHTQFVSRPAPGPATAMKTAALRRRFPAASSNCPRATRPAL